MKIRKVVIPAAGLGTRFLPATKAQPKEMLPIVDKPILQYIVEEAVDSGIEEILLITGRNKKNIEDHFDRSVEMEMELEAKGKEDLLQQVRKISNMVNIHYIRQKEPLGLGHAVSCAQSFIGEEPFAVMLGDDIVYNPERPCLAQMIEVYEKYGGSILGVQEVAEEAVSKYGIMQGEPQGAGVLRVEDLVEKPAIDEAPSRIAILGRYILSPTVFGIIERIEPGKGGEIQLTDALRELARQEPVYAYTFAGRRYDAGDKLGYLEATVEYALRREDLREDFLAFLRRTIER